MASKYPQEESWESNYHLFQQMILTLGENYAANRDLEGRNKEIVKNLYEEGFPSNQFSREILLDTIIREYNFNFPEVKIHLMSEDFQNRFIDPYILEHRQTIKNVLYKKIKKSKDILELKVTYDIIICPLKLPKDLISFYIFMPKLTSGMCFFQHHKTPYPHFGLLNSLFSDYCAEMGKSYHTQIVNSRPSKDVRNSLRNMYNYCVLIEILNSEDFQKSIKGEPSLGWCICKIDVSIKMELLVKKCIFLFLEILYPLSNVFDFETLKFLETFINMQKLLKNTSSPLESSSKDNMVNNPEIIEGTLYHNLVRAKGFEKVLRTCIMHSSRAYCWEILREQLFLYPHLLTIWANYEANGLGPFFKNRGNFRKFKRILRDLHLGLPPILQRPFPRRTRKRRNCPQCKLENEEALNQNILSFNNMSLNYHHEIATNFSTLNVQDKIIIRPNYYPVSVDPTATYQDPTPVQLPSHGYQLIPVQLYPVSAYNILLSDTNNNSNHLVHHYNFQTQPGHHSAV